MVACTAKVQFLAAGRGSGKTTGVARPKLAYECLRNKDHRYGYFAPTYAISLREWARMRRDHALRPYIREANTIPIPHIEWITGSYLCYRSCDRPDNLLGEHYHGVVIDEIQSVKESLINQTIGPQLRAHDGWMLLMGQFDEDGEDGWLYKQYAVPGKDMTQDKIRFWQIPTHMGPMFQTEEKKADLEFTRSRLLDREWRRWYMAEPIEGGNKAFRSADLLEAGKESNFFSDIGVSRVLEHGINGQTYVMGVDIGRVSDPSAFAVLQPLPGERAAVVAARSFPLGQYHERTSDQVAQIQRDFDAQTVVIDATGGGAGGKGRPEERDVYAAFYEKKVRNCRKFFLTKKVKQNICADLCLAFEQKKLFVPEELTELRQQLKKFIWKREFGGNVDYGGAPGEHDDIVLSLAYAYRAIVQHWYSDNNKAKISLNSVL